MKQLSSWSLLKNLINAHPVGSIITRKELIAYLQSCTNISEQTIDTYRLKLTNKEYLVRHKRGRYKVAQHIPDDLTTH